MKKLLNKTYFASLIFGIMAFMYACAVNADSTTTDPTAQVARLSYIGNPVLLATAGNSNWISPDLNRPLVTGDQLGTDVGGRAELQLSNAALRLSAQTSLNILNLQNNVAQFQLTQGTLNFHVWDMQPSQQYEIDTPNLAFVITQPGDYRIDVDTKGNATVISVNQGQGMAYGKTASNQMDASNSCIFSGTDLNNTQCSTLPAPDPFDQWCLARDNSVDNSVSAQYVPLSVIGAADLGNYGTWTNLPGYGNAWTPNNVPANWAPYTQGHWDSIAPWGWTWVDDEAWGFAPFHYGRWTFVNNVWYWLPGPSNVAPVYAPALVAFVGGNNELQVGNSPSVAWFPLGPGDVYVPPYPVSPTYFTNINSSNAFLNNASILAVYNNPQIFINYHNYRFANAITVVPRNVFIQSQGIFNVRIRITNVNNFYRIPISHIIHFGPAPVYRPMRTLRPPATRPLVPIRPPQTRPLTPLRPAMAPLKPPATRPMAPLRPAMAPLKPPATRPMAPVRPAMAPLKPPATRPMQPITPAHKTAPMKPVTPAMAHTTRANPAMRQLRPAHHAQPYHGGRGEGQRGRGGRGGRGGKYPWGY